MTDLHPIVIIGSGQAGVSLARELRKKSGDIPITIITDDAGGFYSKPMLSNAFCKKMPLERLKIQDAATLAEKTKTTVKAFTRVEGIDVNLKRLHLKAVSSEGSSENLIYDKLIFAVGGTPFQPPIPGIEYAQSINHLDHYLSLRTQISAFTPEKPVRISIIGGGLVGCELANDLHVSGASVTLIERENQLLPRVASPLVSEQLSRTFESIGIQCLTSCHVDHIVKSPAPVPTYTVNFKAEPASHQDSSNRQGSSQHQGIEADIVVSALGLRANIALAKQTGLSTDLGIQCSRTLATSIPDIYAIGDCAEIEGLVLPYILPIMEAAKALASTLTGDTTEIKYPCMPVAVKTTAYPLVVCPPKTISDNIRVENTTHEAGFKTLYFETEQLVGFSLGGTAMSERQALALETLGLLEQ